MKEDVEWVAKELRKQGVSDDEIKERCAETERVFQLLLDADDPDHVEGVLLEEEEK